MFFSLGQNDVIADHFTDKSDTTYRLPSFFCNVSLFLSFFKIPAGRMFVSVSVSVSSGGETKRFRDSEKKFSLFFDVFIGQYIVAFFCVYGYNLSVPGGLSGDSRRNRP